MEVISQNETKCAPSSCAGGVEGRGLRDAMGEGGGGFVQHIYALDPCRFLFHFHPLRLPHDMCKCIFPPPLALADFVLFSKRLKSDSQILQIPSRKRNVCHHLDLAIADGLDVDVVAEIARAAFDLDAVVEEFLEGAQVEDLVRDGLRAVDGVLDPQERDVVS